MRNTIIIFIFSFFAIACQQTPGIIIAILTGGAIISMIHFAETKKTKQKKFIPAGKNVRLKNGVRIISVVPTQKGVIVSYQ